MTKKPKHKGIANSVKKDGTSKIVELVLPTLKESYAINHPKYNTNKLNVKTKIALIKSKTFWPFSLSLSYKIVILIKSFLWNVYVNAKYVAQIWRNLEISFTQTVGELKTYLIITSYETMKPIVINKAEAK